MQARVYVYLTDRTDFRGSWANAGGEGSGWPTEGGWLHISDPDDHEGGVTVYLDRAQVVRLKGVIDGIVEAMPTAGSGLDAVRVESKA